MKLENFNKALLWIKENSTFLLITHVQPDIDGLASILTLAQALNYLGKKALPGVEEIPEEALFLHGSSLLKLPEEINDFRAEVVIVVDTHSPKRVPQKIWEKLNLKAKFLIIDHHVWNKETSFSEEEILIIDSKVPSTTYLIYQLLKVGNFPITSEMAENLLAGLYFDTGAFRYENVTEETFLFASELVNLGARPSWVACQIFENISLAQVEFLKKILQNLEFINRGEIAISYLTFEDFQKIGVFNLSKDWVNFLRSLQGVKVAVLLKEVEKGKVSVSLRSKAPFEVVELAKKFGGGGHRYASGFKVETQNFKDTLTYLKNFISEFYERKSK